MTLDNQTDGAAALQSRKLLLLKTLERSLRRKRESLIALRRENQRKNKRSNKPQECDTRCCADNDNGDVGGEVEDLTHRQSPDLG